MIRLILITLVSITSSLFAQGTPINIGIESFDPPFIMEGANNSIYGFDIDMMNCLCKIMERDCKYEVMPFHELLNAVTSKKVDAAISSISITPERTKIVNFSLPYLLSYSRFLERSAMPNQPFNLVVLNGKKIGLQEGSVFSDQLKALGVKNPDIKDYISIEDQLSALNKGDVDYIMLDNATAIYWANNSSDTFKLFGPPFMYGYGYAIAINPSESDLLTEINNALARYQSSDDYKRNYNQYFF